MKSLPAYSLVTGPAYWSLVSMLQRLVLRRALSTAKDIYFGTNTLNRHSFLRTDPSFISQAITSPYAKLIFFDKLAPLVDTHRNELASLNYTTLGKSNREIIDNWAYANAQGDTISLLQSPLVHFLGLDTLTHSPFQYKNKYSGTPYFAISTDNSPSLQSKLNSLPNVRPLTTREEVNVHLDYAQSSIFAQAKMYLEWLSTTLYCRGCGSHTIAINAGSELRCTNPLPCPVKDAPVSNASFPRLDPVLITCVLNSSRDKVLFTRHAKFPKGMYTHIAGFIEPGETVENAVIREVWEECGLRASNVQIVKTQPWPYPMNIILGCVAIVHNGEMDLGHDPELEHAFWCDISNLKTLVEQGKEDENLTLMVPELAYGIPNDKTLATKLYQYIVEHYT